MTEKSETDRAIEDLLSSETTTQTTSEVIENQAPSQEAPEKTEEEAAQPLEAGTDWKAEARKWEARSKENKEKADLADSLQSRVSELETALKAAADKSNLEVARWKTAAKHGVSEEDVDLFLTGTDEETLEKQAERLSQTSSRSPKPDVAQGNRSNQAIALSPKQQGAAAMADLFE